MVNGAAFKIGQKVVFTAKGNEALAAEGRAAIMQGAELAGPRDPKDGSRYAVGTVTDCTADRVTVAVQGLSGLGETFTLDSWYAACSACVREHVPLPMPPEPGKPTCKAHAIKAVEQKKAEKAKGGEDKGEENNSVTMEETVAKGGNGKTKGVKVSKEKVAKVAAGAGRKPQWDPELKIKLLVTENPKREGSQAHKKFAELLKNDGKTVAEFLALEGRRTALDKEKGWPAGELRYNLVHKYISLSK